MTITTMATNSIFVQSRLQYEVQKATDFQLQIAVRPSQQQSLDEERFSLFYNDQAVLRDNWSDEVIPENGNRCHRFHAEPGQWRIEYDASVCKNLVDHDARDQRNGSIASLLELPVEILPYLNPSRYCESDRLIQQAENQFGQLPRDASLVQSLEEAVFQRTDYAIGSSNVQTTATDTYLGAAGVCRDFAHLLIALCRAMRIPARYASGYLVDLQPSDFHAAVEAYVDGNWLLFDATRLAPLSGFVTIGIGRDAADVDFASFSGNVRMTICDVSVYENHANFRK